MIRSARNEIALTGFVVLALALAVAFAALAQQHDRSGAFYAKVVAIELAGVTLALGFQFGAERDDESAR
jgi:hypothetical protein